MRHGKITQKQRIVLDCIKQYIKKNSYPPTVRELCELLNLKSTSAVHFHLTALEKNGYIKRDPAKPRCIEIIENTPIDAHSIMKITVSGDKLTYLGIHHNDIIFMEQTSVAKNGDIIVVLLKGNITIGRLVKKNNRLELFHNDTISPMVLSEKNIVGRIVGIFRSFE